MTDTPFAQEQAQKALQDEVRARAEATRSESAAAVAYREYLEFEQAVLAAEEAFTDADDAAKKAAARHRARAEEVEASKAKASRLDKAAAKVRAAWAEQGLYRPATGGVTSSFGPRVHPVTGVYKLHTGTDFAGTDGNYYAMADGVVTYAGYDGAYGYMVKVDHGNVSGHKTESWYAHQPGLNVSVGQSVSRGEVIGRIGNTGYSTGPHAHVELHLNGQPVDLLAHLP
jgi:murein DD-endopeptidase MepM/ murein hydrolase activator NlpD